jgi:hypothetical protein
MFNTWIFRHFYTMEVGLVGPVGGAVAQSSIIPHLTCQSDESLWSVWDARGGGWI